MIQTVVKEKPILFSGEMVQALLDGRKTQTRRVIKSQPVEVTGGKYLNWKFPKPGPLTREEFAYYCPYGRVGDRLWVRETWAKVYDDWPPVDLDSPHIIEFKADTGNRYPGHWPEEHKDDEACGQWKSGRFMPKWAARIWLEVTGIRAEHLQDIAIEDCIAEGITTRLREHDATVQLHACFVDLWDSLNAKRGYSWSSNPFVWVLTFKRIQR